jgi:hypothetical protein
MGLNSDCYECSCWVMEMWIKQNFSHIPTTLSIFIENKNSNKIPT